MNFTCKSCRWFRANPRIVLEGQQPAPPGTGACIRNPPTPVFIGKGFLGMRPPVTESDGCGEYQREAD